MVILSNGETYLKPTAGEEVGVVSLLKYTKIASHFLPAASTTSLAVSSYCLPAPYSYKPWSSEPTHMHLFAWHGLDAEEATMDLVSGAIPWLMAIVQNPNCPGFLIWIHFFLVLA